jgi:hypothetical protein
MRLLVYREGAMKCKVLTLSLIYLCFVLPCIEAQEEKPKAKAIEASVTAGEWELKPLLIKGSPMPGGGGSFENFDKPIWLQSGVMTFWDRSVLYSIKDGKVRRVLAMDEKLPAVGSNTAKLKPKELNALTPGKNLLYIGAVQTGTFAFGKYVVYTWDGEQLKLLLGADSEVEIGGARKKISSALVSMVSPDGKALITCRIGRSSHQWDNWVVHDGSNQMPLDQILLVGKPLPAMPGVTVQSIITPPYDSQAHFVRLFADGAVAMLKLAGATYKEALVRVTPEKAEKIIAIGEPDPFEPTNQVRDILGISSVDRNNVVFVMNSSKGDSHPVLVLHRNGKFYKLFDRNLPGVKNKTLWSRFNIGDGFFLESESPYYAFRVMLYRQLTKDERNRFSANYEIIPHLFFFDGETVHQLSESIPTTGLTYWSHLSELGKGPYEVSGAIVHGVNARGIRFFDTGIQLESEQAGTSWLLETSGQEFIFKPAPEFNVPGKKITLGDVVGWKSSTEAIVKLSDGFYLLSKLR